ncbi:hypothetical protein DSM43518_05045 [Mycobacterium marinum]|nr:hypothetical protein DSM43518_05045 [Mycobacterium marinum]
MPLVVRGVFRVGRRWRCSMAITRCGSVRGWVILGMRVARLLLSWLIGSGFWRGCRSVWRCLLIGLIRRWLIIVVAGWVLIGRWGCSSRLLGWLVSIMRPVSWWFRRRWRWCWPRSVRVLRWRYGWLVSIMRPVSWWFRRRWRWCWPRSVRVLRWRWGFRSLGVVIVGLMSWWGCLSTRWCCGLICRLIPPLRICWRRCVRAVLMLTSIRTCRLRCWWSG